MMFTEKTQAQPTLSLTQQPQDWDQAAPGHTALLLAAPTIYTLCS